MSEGARTPDWAAYTVWLESERTNQGGTMSDDAQDPREDVLRDMLDEAADLGNEYVQQMDETDRLRDLDTADPLRAMLPEIVRTLEIAYEQLFYPPLIGDILRRIEEIENK